MNIITLSSFQVMNLALGGYFFDRLENVVLSCSNNSIMPYLSVFNFLTENIAMSAFFPPVTGMPLSDYVIQGQNKLIVKIEGITNQNVFYDIIFLNAAGYSKLSDKNYLIRSK